MPRKLPYAKAVITGSTGFVGERLMLELASRGIEVHGLALGKNKNLAKVRGIHMHIGDITDKKSMQRFMRKVRPEVVFHLAAYGTFVNEQDVQRMIDVNIKGASILLETSREVGCKAFISTSSAKVYATGRTPIKEHQEMFPWDNYAVTKTGAELFCKLYSEKHSFPVTTFRLCPVYGPGDDLSRFIPTAIGAVINSTPFTCSVGSLVRNFTYIDDAIEAFIQASRRMKGTYEVFNIGYKKAHSFNEILSAIQKVTGKKMDIIVPPSKQFVDHSWVLDMQKAEKVLKWRGKVSLMEGIARTVGWYTTKEL